MTGQRWWARADGGGWFGVTVGLACGLACALGTDLGWAQAPVAAPAPVAAAGADASPHSNSPDPEDLYQAYVDERWGDTSLRNDFSEYITAAVVTGGLSVGGWIWCGYALDESEAPGLSTEDQEEATLHATAACTLTSVATFGMVWSLLAIPVVADPVPEWEFGFNAGPEGGLLTAGGTF